MSDWSIQNYKTTPASNAAVNGIDIADKTGLPGHLNDALRQVMADVASSGLSHPELYISEDEGNALVPGSDGLLWVDPETVAGGTPVLYISADEGNTLHRGADGRLSATREDVLAMPWESVTGKPDAFAPVPHAASHGPNGGDQIASFFPRGFIALWWGDAADLDQKEWMILEAPAGLFPVGAGASLSPGQSGGYASGAVELRTITATVIGYDTHTHSLNGMTAPVSKAYEPDLGLTRLTTQLGYSASGSPLQTRSAGSGSHTHDMTLPLGKRPPYLALRLIMKL